MSESIRVSERFHNWVEAHKKEGETMEDALLRLIGVPHPNEVADILSEEQVDDVEEAIENAQKRNQQPPLNKREAFIEEIQRTDIVRLLARYDREKHRKIYDDLANE